MDGDVSLAIKFGGKLKRSSHIMVENIYGIYFQIQNTFYFEITHCICIINIVMMCNFISISFTAQHWIMKVTQCMSSL